VQQLANEMHGTHGRIAYYVMTSGPTHDKTVAFFQQHAYFGLAQSDVVFFRQVRSTQRLVLMKIALLVARIPGFKAKHCVCS
jgi:UDP-N-acetylglucosamine pyrophosphorylase